MNIRVLGTPICKSPKAYVCLLMEHNHGPPQRSGNRACRPRLNLKALHTLSMGCTWVKFFLSSLSSQRREKLSYICIALHISAQRYKTKMVLFVNGGKKCLHSNSVYKSTRVLQCNKGLYSVQINLISTCTLMALASSVSYTHNTKTL